MLVYYLDTSAILKRYRIEAGTATVDELFDHSRSDEALLTSYLGALEVEAVAARLLRGRVLRRQDYQRFLNRFADDTDTNLTLYPLTNEILEASVDLIRHYALRAADAVHLESARRIRTASGMRIIYTASDHALIDAARAEGFDILDPEDTGSLQALSSFRSV